MKMIIRKNGSPTRRDATLTLAALLVAGAASGCSLLRKHWHYRYRLAAEVEWRGKVFHGSSVVEVLRSQGSTRVEATVRGEAVAVDVGDVGTLFLLLRQGWGDVDWPFTVPHKAFADRLGSSSVTDPALLTRLTKMVGEKATVDPTDYPLMIVFRDIRKPLTVQEVKPDQLGHFFGEGAKLRQVTIEITNDPITGGIRHRFPWWGEFLEKHFDGSTVRVENARTNDLAAHLSSYSFTSER